MLLSRSEILIRFDSWLHSWNTHNLDGVMDFMHEDVLFENWNGSKVCGKLNLHLVWKRWFDNHGNFKFSTEEIFIDQSEQNITFCWQLKWPSPEKQFSNEPEIRRGVDVMHLKDGKIISKITYCKTQLRINNQLVTLQA